MKPFLKFTSLLLLPLLLCSCNNSENNSSASWVQENEISENKEYTIDDFELSIEWTAYRFTDRIGVSGTFNNYSINKKNTSGSIEDVLNNLQLSIPTESIDTENAIRDFKISTYFFKIFNTSTITGTVLNASEGQGDIKLKMNNISYKTPYTYSLENDTIILITHLDLNKWKGEEALASLHKEYDELHDITDDTSKLWAGVDVVVRLPVNNQSNNENSGN